MASDLIHLLAEDAWARRLVRALVGDAAGADDLVQASTTSGSPSPGST